MKLSRGTEASLIGIAGLALTMAAALSGCSVDRAPAGPTGPIPSDAEVQSLLGAPASKVDDIARDRADVMIDVTLPLTGVEPPSETGDVSALTIVAACVLATSSGGPRGFATGVIPTDQVTSAIRAKALAGDYRDLLAPNCAPRG